MVCIGEQSPVLLSSTKTYRRITAPCGLVFVYACIMPVLGGDVNIFFHLII